jgi:hypothetical protein
MVVTRYMNGKEITLEDIQRINLSDNPVIRELLNRILYRINHSIEEDTFTDEISA